MMPQPTSRPCEVCGRPTEQQRLYEIRGCAVFRCRICGLGSTQVPAGVTPVDLYQESYFDGSQRDGYGDYLGSEPVLRREFRATVAALLNCVPAGGRLLEVGCAYGFFMKEARQHYECVGIEVSSSAVRHCQTSGLDVRHGTLEDVASSGDLGDFDAIVMLDVIEHLERPLQTLQRLRVLARPQAVLMITTGDWNSAVARAMGRRWRLMTPPQHLFFFSNATLGSLLARAGFTPETWTHPWKTVPVGLVVYQAARRCGLDLPIGESLYRVGVPVNLFDAIRVIARATGEALGPDRS
jgi:SAM-dependent methyltransferase